MRYKRPISLLLTILIFITSVPLNLLAARPVVYMQDGYIKMEFENKKASTGTRFKTIGWIVHSKPGNGSAANTQKYGKMIGSDMQQVREDDHGDGTLTTYFEINESAVDRALISANLGSIAEGGTFYLDAIFTVTNNGVPNGKQYYTLKDIQNAAPWGSQTMKDLANYFDIPITFKGKDYDLEREIRVNGELIKREKIAEGKPGSKHKVTLQDKITLEDGSEATLKESYEYSKLNPSQKENIKVYPDSGSTDREVNMSLGGTVLVGSYTKQPTVTVRHVNYDTKDVLEETSAKVKPGETFSASAKNFDPLKYTYSVISNDGGNTWKDRSDKTTRNIIVNKDAIIEFYYSKNTDIIADLKLTASPDSINKGSTSKVDFTLDASGSKSKYPIVKYEYWLSEDESDLNGSRDYDSTKNKQTSEKSGVEPNSKWYGKVVITDSRGNTSEARTTITIGESASRAEVIAKIDADILNSSSDMSNVYHVADYINRVEMVEKDDRFPESENRPAIVVYMNKPDKSFFLEDGSARYGLGFDIEVSGKNSKSTNGVGKTEMYYNYNSSDEISLDGDDYSKSATFESRSLDADDVTWIWKQLESDAYDWVSRRVAVTAYDSVDTSASDTAILTIYFVGVPKDDGEDGLKPPSVDLTIDRNVFTYGEEASFKATYVEEPGKTYAITDKSWEIGSTETDFTIVGNGEIPEKYVMNMGEGTYYARQYIYYKDAYENDLNAYDEVEFSIVGLRDPDVSISSDKEKYYAPTTGIFTVNYDEDEKFTHHIDNREFALKDDSGQVLTSGQGTFPREYFFADSLASGYYTAEQTIYWWAEGEYKSKTASCRFKLISPVPSAEFEVNMKMSSSSDDWLRIDVPNESGKQYKQIRIDLTPSIKLNQDLENPNPIDFSSQNTQIQILPLTYDLQADRTKNSTIHTLNASDKQLVDDTVTFKGKQYIDVRFDEPGKYRVKARVASGKYISQWVVRDITIREDLPPIVTLTLGNVTLDNGRLFTYRLTDDLSANFNVSVSARSQDDDVVDYSTAKLELRYDYNADQDTSNDGAHSSMFFKQNAQSLQPYMSVNSDGNMTNFSIRMFDSTASILGKVRVEYLVTDKPTIPNFVGGSLPAVPVKYGSTYSQPENEKVLWIDNKAGVIKMYLEGTTKKEINIVMGSDTLHFDLDMLKSYYGDDVSIYIIDKNGNREQVH